MKKSFFGLDLKTAGKVVLMSHFIENLLMYIVSLVLMMQHPWSNVHKLQSFLFVQEELENHVKLRKAITFNRGFPENNFKSFSFKLSSFQLRSDLLNGRRIDRYVLSVIRELLRLQNCTFDVCLTV